MEGSATRPLGLALLMALGLTAGALAAENPDLASGAEGGPPTMGSGMMQGQGPMGPGMMQGQGPMGPGMMQGQGPMGPGMMQGQGSMGPGMMQGQGPMGPGMMQGQGPMGPGMMGDLETMWARHHVMHAGHGHGPSQGGGLLGLEGRHVVPMVRLSAEDVRLWFESYLDRIGNPRLEVGTVEEVDESVVRAAIVTVDDSLVESFDVDRRTGRISSGG